MKKHCKRVAKAMERFAKFGFEDKMPRYLRQGIIPGRHFPVAQFRLAAVLVPVKAKLEDLED